MLDFVDLDQNDPRWAHALPVLQELRPHLTKELLHQVLTEGGPQGLHFTALYADGRCVAVAGWRVMTTTHTVRKLHVDDLSTAAACRSHGYGHHLLEHLAERGPKLGCRVLDLDSGVQRFDAHRFYLRERMRIASHHFSLPLEDR